jgi:uncharacterized protein
MVLASLAPGVIRQEIAPAAPAALPTGVPGFVGLGVATTGAPVVRLESADDLAALVSLAPGSYLASVIRGFFDNGGARCHVAVALPAAPDRAAALIAALDALRDVEDIDLIAIPDAMLPRDAEGAPELAGAIRVQRAALSHCAASGTRFAVLDSPPGASPETVLAQRRALALGLPEPLNGALYYPWLIDSAGRRAPPCGCVAGLIAATDAAAGVFKAPAGSPLIGVLDLERRIGEADQPALNAAGVNCLRAFPGRGIRVWGARTLSADPQWRYVNVRRVVLTLMRWIDANLGWAAFEPNAPTTWARIDRAIAAHLTGLWQAGALRGTAPAQAFFVKCDAETNPPEVRDDGRLLVEIGLAPASPAEFVVVKLALRPSESV